MIINPEMAAADEIIVPNGKFIIEENDKIHVIGRSAGIYNFCRASGMLPEKLKNIMILGGGRKTVIIPHGNDTIQNGGYVIVISRHKNINSLEELTISLNGGNNYSTTYENKLYFRLQKELILQLKPKKIKSVLKSYSNYDIVLMN